MHKAPGKWNSVMVCKKHTISFTHINEWCSKRLENENLKEVGEEEEEGGK